MSTSTKQQQDQATQQVTECDLAGCERAGRKWTFQGGCCTREHWERHVGRKALSEVRTSHTRCYTCFATLKDIELPKPDSAFDISGVELTYDPEEDRLEVLRYSQEVTCDAAIGYQYRRPEADIGQINAGPLVVTGTVCGECGSASLSQHVDTVADGHRTAARAVEHLWSLDDSDFSSFDPELLHREYAESSDIAQAAGAAIIKRRS